MRRRLKKVESYECSVLYFTNSSLTSEEGSVGEGEGDVAGEAGAGDAATLSFLTAVLSLALIESGTACANVSALQNTENKIRTMFVAVRFKGFESGVHFKGKNDVVRVIICRASKQGSSNPAAVCDRDSVCCVIQVFC